MTPDPTLIEQFQRDRSEWFSAPVREILGEYETWRSGQGSAALPSEAITGEMRFAGRKAAMAYRLGGPNDDALDAIYTAMRATTPTAPWFQDEEMRRHSDERTAPVQDDDAELSGALTAIEMGLTFAYQRGLHEFGYDPVKVVRSRLSPTPETGLIEALEKCATALNSFIYIIAHRFDGDGSYYWMREPTHDEAQAAMEANNNALRALSNTSPAQPEDAK